MLTPARGSLTSTSFGATIHLTHIDNTGNLSNHVVCWTPTDADSHHFFAIDLVPRPRVQVPEPLLRSLITTALRLGLYSTAVQDAALLKHRPNAPDRPTPDSTGASLPSDDTGTAASKPVPKPGTTSDPTVSELESSRIPGRGAS